MNEQQPHNKQSEIKLVKKNPPVVAPSSPQYDLFSTFLGDEKDLSNTIELWDSTPKFCVSKRQQNYLRDQSGRLPVYERDFVYRRSVAGQYQALKARLTIRPALVREKDNFKDYYPSINEELLLEVLIKIFADQDHGIHDPAKRHSWVNFSLSIIRKELQAKGRTKSIQQIKESLEILSQTNLEVKISGDDETLSFSGNILQDLRVIRRKKYEADPKSQWCVRLPQLITDCIDNRTYRQFNYAKLMNLDCQLQRWLFKLLAHRFTNASLDRTYNIKLSTIIRDSGYLNNSVFRKNLASCKKSLEALCKESILLDYTVDAIIENNHQIDAMFNLTPHPFFVSEIKAANKRLQPS